jgi:flagellar protein FliS
MRQPLLSLATQIPQEYLPWIAEEVIGKRNKNIKMATQYNNYLETEVLNADPIHLVGILYRAAIASVGAARYQLQAGEIRERSRSIARAEKLIHELTFSLDYERGGKLSQSLASLYTYMQGRLIEANTKQIAPPLAEVEQLLSTLLEAWSAIRPQPAYATA